MTRPYVAIAIGGIATLSAFVCLLRSMGNGERRMSHYKRKKCRRSIRCSICTPVRWLGNNKDRVKHRDRREMLRGA